MERKIQLITLFYFRTKMWPDSRISRSWSWF